MEVGHTGENVKGFLGSLRSLEKTDVLNREIMRTEIKGVEFSYPSIYKSLIAFSATVIAIVAIWIAAMLIPVFFSPGVQTDSPASLLFSRLIAFLVILIPITILTVQLNSAQDFVLSEKGLRLQIFHLWWKELPWDAVIELNENWLFPGFAAVVLKRLTPFHNLLGIIYAFTNNPAFIIHISLGLDPYKKALDIIRKHAVNLR